MKYIMISVCSVALSLSVVGCALEGDALIEVAEDSIMAESFEAEIDADADAEIGTEADEDFGTEDCWVVLEWCQHPVTGTPVCSASGSTCTIHQIEYHCGVLTRQYC